MWFAQNLEYTVVGLLIIVRILCMRTPCPQCVPVYFSIWIFLISDLDPCLRLSQYLLWTSCHWKPSHYLLSKFLQTVIITWQLREQHSSFTQLRVVMWCMVMWLDTCGTLVKAYLWLSVYQGMYKHTHTLFIKCCI